MKLALRLALVTGALVLGGAGLAAARAWATAPGLAIGLLAGGVTLAAALVALLLSSRAEDHDPMSALLHAGVAVALGVGLERTLAPELPAALPPGALQGAVVLLAALVLCARIGLRRTDFSSLPTPDLLRAAARSTRAHDAALALLPARADALDAVVAVSTTDPDPWVRLKTAALLGAAAPPADPAARARAVAAAVKALDASADHDAARIVGIRLAFELAHPDLIPPLRRMTPGDDRWALLEARAACGDLDVLDDLLAADDADRARDVARHLRGAALPAITGRLARAGDDDAARLLALVGALPRSDAAFELAAARAGADQPKKVRAAALRALHDLDPARAVPLARTALDADDLMVRTWAQSILRAAGV